MAAAATSPGSFLAAEVVPARRGGSGRQWSSSGAPLRLVMVCALQLALLAFGTLSAVHVSMCGVDSSNGTHTIRCDDCGRTSFSVREGLLLAGGCAVIGLGLAAACLRHRKLCKAYGLLMIVFAFLVGLSAVLTGISVPMLQDAVDRVKHDEKCRRTAQNMVNAVRDRAILYGVTALMNLAGAVWAMRAKRLFDYIEIRDRSVQDRALLDARL